MKTFLSILSIPIRPESEEKIALGLLLSDGTLSRFHFSVNKLRIVRELVSDSSYNFIKMYLKSIEKVSLQVDESAGRINFPELIGSIVNEPYFDYLSVYNNNVLVFSKPVRIDLPVTEAVFNRLFEKYIDVERPKIEKSLKRVPQVKEEFLPRVIKYFSEEKEITEKEFQSIIIPVKLDLLGKNEIPVFAQFIDLERQNLNLIKNDYYDLKQLKDAIDQGKGFLITSEPDKEIYNRQHDIWLHIWKSKEFEIIDISEVDKVEEYAVEHGVRPW